MLTVAAGRDTPAPAPLHIIGGQAAGCIAGAVRLPAEGPGFQTIHLSRSSFWGAPSTIARVEALGEQVRAAGLGDLYIEDISRPRGGPLPGGHLSHQLGLDVDVGLDMTPKRTLTAAERETVELPSMVGPDQRGVASRWTADQVTLLHLAASLPEVDRILINPAIKRQLCEEARGDRSWLRLLRPWTTTRRTCTSVSAARPISTTAFRRRRRRRAMAAMRRCNGGSIGWTCRQSRRRHTTRRPCRPPARR